MVLTSCNSDLADLQENTLANEVLQSEENEVKQIEGGQIFLYGEVHSNEKILNEEFKLWKSYYEQGTRHLFIEDSYYGSEFLNLWMQSDDDTIFNQIYKDRRGTAGDSLVGREFYKKIKAECPETIFHGTDVGHQYNSSGARYLKYLEDNGMKDTDKYVLTLEAIEQGKKYYEGDHAYRENMMVENFIREFDALEEQSVMGIYGASHTGVNDMHHSARVPSMANQLNQIYDKLYSTDLSYMADKESEGSDEIEIEGTIYKGNYYGKTYIKGASVFKYVEFWCLEDAYEDFKDKPMWTGLANRNYPFTIEDGQVYVVDYKYKSGDDMRVYYRSDGLRWNGVDATSGFSLSEIEKTEPLGEETLTIEGKSYPAVYYGEIEVDMYAEVQRIKYWKIPNAYEDFIDHEIGDLTFISSNYPFEIEDKGIYVIELLDEGSEEGMLVFRCDGQELNGMLITQEIRLDNEE